MNRGTILLRVDGTAAQGMGRIARCLALANALQRRRYQMTFLSQLDNATWPERIRRFRHTVAKTPFAAGSDDDQAMLSAEILRRNPVVVITDSPNLSEEYLALVAARVPLLISLDTGSRLRFPSDLVLNPTLGLGPEDYQLYPQSQLVVGNKYAMVRAEFRRARNVRATEPGGPMRVLLALGGGDVGKESYHYAKALLKSNRIEKIDAVLGTTPKIPGDLEALAEEHKDRLHLVTDARDLGVRMTKSHLLITSGGNTALEAACVGIPMLVVTRRKEQVLNANWLEEMGAAQYLGAIEKVSGSQLTAAADAVLEDNFERKAMSRSGRLLIDGRGADRIVTAAEILLQRTRRSKALAA